eukprot:scaffold8019_cov133-Isochrysis_galbana.AAC.9
MKCGVAESRYDRIDKYHLLWTKERDFDPTGKGTPTTAKPWINKHTRYTTPSAPTSAPQT